VKKNALYILTSLVIMGSLYFLVFRRLNLVKRFAKNIPKLLQNFSPSIVSNMEKIYRLETNHFKSGQFIGTFSPGMEAFDNKFPYGWKTMNSILWTTHKNFAPIGIKIYSENNTSKQKRFLVFPSLFSAMFTVCTFLEYFGNNPGRWFSLNVESQNKYNNSIAKIKATITNNYV
jgi:hypothetical protein